MECLGQFDPGLVEAERSGLLEDPSYIKDLPADHPIRANQNVFAFGMGVASLEVLQFLSMVIAPSESADIGAQNYDFVTGRLDVETDRCRSSCLYSGSLLAMGNQLPPIFDRHPVAEQERAERARRANMQE